MLLILYFPEKLNLKYKDYTNKEYIYETFYKLLMQFQAESINPIILKPTDVLTFPIKAYHKIRNKVHSQSFFP